MLEARSVALVGASPRPATFGRRMSEEVAKSASRPRIYPVNPKYAELDGRRCYPSLADLPEAVDLVLLAVPDAALTEQLSLAGRLGARSAVIFGSAFEGRERLTAVASAARMELCGAGCMGFINVSRGLRAIGYTEPDPVPDGPVALVTHSGSVFSALLRARRRLGFTLAVSSGQELVTTTPAYLDYALDLPETQGDRARARGDQGRRRPAAHARSRRGAGDPRGPAHDRNLSGGPGHGRRALRRARGR